MKIAEILKYLKSINVKSRLEAALMILNERRETDETNISLAFQHRDRIRRVFLSSGLDISFSSNKLILVSKVGVFEIKSYNNKNKVSSTNNLNENVQLSLLPIGDKDTILDGSVIELCYELDRIRRQYTDLFLQYVSANGEKYSVSLMSVEQLENKEENTFDKEDEYQPKFIRAKIEFVKDEISSNE